jgi:DNA-directed RNA polymerase subunit A'
VITLENVKDEIFDKAKKVKVCPHCQKEQYDLVFTKPTIFVEKTDAGENRPCLLLLERDWSTSLMKT